MTEAGLVIVAYNDETTLGRCVDSVVRAGFGGAITIVDNCSSDGTAAVASDVAARHHQVAIVTSTTNLGYAGGFNLGRSAMHVPFVGVMNADCELEGDWIGPCVDVMESHPSVAATCPTVSLADRAMLNAEGLVLHKAGFGFNRHLGVPISKAGNVAAPVDGVQGTAFVIRTSFLDLIGGWSDMGFLYHEDVELSWAIRSVGMEIWHIPTPLVVHDYELTMSPEKLFLLERNRVELLLTYLGFWSRMKLLPLILATEAAVWFYAISRRGGLPGAKWASYWAALKRRALWRIRREEVMRFRTRSDMELLSPLRIAYPTDQTRVLLTSQPTTGRRGQRDLPKEG